MLPRRLAGPAERRRQLLLPIGDLLRPPKLLVTKPKPLLGQVVERPDELALPLGPDAGTDRADIDHGKDGQKAESLGALHLSHEVVDGLGVGKVALEGGVADQEMMAHQPGDGIGFARIQPEAGAQLAGDLLAEDRMIALPPLGDVVEQHRDIEHAARADLPEQRGGERVVLGQFTALDRRQKPDRADGMLVDRVVMIHIELHLRDDAAEVGDEAAEDIGLVHPAQHQLGMVAGGQYVEKQGVGRWVVADLLDQPCIAGRRSHRTRVDFELLVSGECEQLEQSARILAEEALVGDGDPAAVDDEAAAQPPRSLQEGRKRETATLGGELFVQLREKLAGQVADAAGLQEVHVHEALDRALPRTVGIIERRRQLALVGEAHPLLGSPGLAVEEEADRPEEALGAVEAGQFRRRQQPCGRPVRPNFRRRARSARPTSTSAGRGARPCRS